LAEVEDPYRRHALPPLDVGTAAARDFEAAFGRLLYGGSYGLERSKADFLRYLVAHHPVLLHGSNDPAIAVFEPRPKPDFLERPVRAVFATSDGVWPIFFAIADRSVVVEMRNNCERAGTTTHYYFSVAVRPPRRDPWSSGHVYILPRQAFSHGYREEWLSSEPVVPLARLCVDPSDFPFLDRVLRHEAGESTEAFLARLRG